MSHWSRRRSIPREVICLPPRGMCDAAGVLTPTRTAGVLAGYAADQVFGDPRRGHPVAGFGAAAAELEHVTYRDSRIAGALHTGVLIGTLSLLGAVIQRAARR